MSKVILDILRSSPQPDDVLVRDLPGAVEWAEQFFRKPVNLDPDASFSEQVLNDSCWGAIFGTVSHTYWDPYDEGYDGGPDNVEDYWRSGGHVSSGQFRGDVVSGVADELGAILATAYSSGLVLNDVLAGSWQPPAGVAERDTRISADVKRLWSKLSDAGKAALLVQLR